MRLEGTLDAFSLPDIFQLLSFTKKTGTLHLRRDADDHGVVHLHEGAVTGGRSDVRRQALGRRIVGAGLVDEDALAEAVERVLSESCGLGRALADAQAVSAADLRAIAAEQATDTVFDLLRWPEGEFAFVVDEANPDDVGAVLPVEDIVAEARRRIASLAGAEVPAPDAVVSLVPSPAEDPVLTRDEWALLGLVDGRRTIADFVALSGRGEYAVVTAFSALVARGLLTYEPAADPLSGLQRLLAELEGGAPVAAAPTPPAARAPEPKPEPAPQLPAARVPAAPAPAPVIPERPEPFTPQRQPEHAEPEPAYARAQRVAATVAAASSGSSSVGEVHGATARQPSAEVAPSAAPHIERDPSVNKSLLLRLIAGVRGL